MELDWNYEYFMFLWVLYKWCTNIKPKKKKRCGRHGSWFGPSSITEHSLGNKLPFMVMLMPSQTTSKYQHPRKPQRWAVPSCQIATINLVIYFNDSIVLKAGWKHLNMYGSSVVCNGGDGSLFKSQCGLDLWCFYFCLYIASAKQMLLPDMGVNLCIHVKEDVAPLKVCNKKLCFKKTWGPRCSTAGWVNAV